MNLFNSKKIKELHKELEVKENLIKELKSRNDFLEKTYKNISHNSEMICEENKKLIQWIEKIIESFDVFEVSNRDRVHIPIYKLSPMPYFDDINKVGRIKQETIVIPEIIINKSKMER